MILQAPKGFRDMLPKDASSREFMLGKIRRVFQKFGFEPLETPSLEYEETLMGKYGEEEKLIYKFETPGGDKVALRYDQTVPLARVVAQYGPSGQQVLPMPFKRYQIQTAFRGENTQKGRYREFLQCDADIVGVSSPLADGEILKLVYEIYKSLGLDIIIKVNDRNLLSKISSSSLAAIDKLNKIGEEGVIKELEGRGLSNEEATKTLNDVKEFKPSQNLQEIIELAEKMDCPKDAIVFEPTMVRGLDYYTGLILEVVLKSDPNSSSLAGGGRWDKMIGKFTGVEQPAVGFAIGFERVMEVMAEQGLFEDQGSAKTLVTIFSAEQMEKSLEAAKQLREASVDTETWLDPEAKLDKQLRYADQKGIAFAIIIGPEEAEANQVVLKDLKNRTQEKLSLDEVIRKLAH